MPSPAGRLHTCSFKSTRISPDVLVGVAALPHHPPCCNILSSIPPWLYLYVTQTFLLLCYVYFICQYGDNTRSQRVRAFCAAGTPRCRTPVRLLLFTTGATSGGGALEALNWQRLLTTSVNSIYQTSSLPWTFQGLSVGNTLPSDEDSVQHARLM